MNYQVLQNRSQAVQFAMRITERFFGESVTLPWMAFAKNLPHHIRRTSGRAITLTKAWGRVPADKYVNAIDEVGQLLQEFYDQTRHGQLQPVIALCACVTHEDWAGWAVQASQTAQQFLSDQCGPGSCDDLEFEFQAIDLQKITNCKLRTIVSIDEDGVEGLREFLEAELSAECKERATALGLRVVRGGIYNNFSFKCKSDHELFLVTSRGKPVGWSDSGWEGISEVLDEIDVESRTKTDWGKAVNQRSVLEQRT